MKTIRCLSLILALLLCMFAMPAGAEVTTVTATYTVDAEELGLPSNDELFAYYVEQKLYGYEWATWGTAAREQLSAPLKAMYDVLKPQVAAIAAGTSDSRSTVFSFTPEWLKNNGFVIEAATSDAVLAELKNGTKELVTALLRDCPFDMFWFDQLASFGVSPFSVYSDGEKSWIKDDINLLLPVSVQFRATAADNTVVKQISVSNVVNNATGIVANGLAAGYSGSQLLQYFADEIMELVSYDERAAKDDTYTSDSNPWNIINVFDGDPNTNVVCEGYAKAFQYLCDIAQTDYNALQDISVITVTGYMVGGTGAGGHMWNVVTMEDGNNYIVDVTNSESGTVGENGVLFLGGTSDTSPRWEISQTDSAGNVVPWGDIYVFRYGNGSDDYVQFNYDNDLPYTSAELKLAPYSYTDEAYITAADGTITGYADAALAFIEWSAGDTLTLRGDHSAAEEISVTGADMVLELNGYDLTFTESGANLRVHSGAELTIIDSKNTGAISSVSYTDTIENSGKLTISGDVSIVSKSAAAITNSGEVSVVGAPTLTGSYAFKYSKGTINLSNAAPAAIDGWIVMNSAGAALDANKIASSFILPDAYALCDTTTKQPLSELKNSKTATITKAAPLAYVADVDGTKYEVFQEAVTAWQKAEDPTTLKLLANVTDFHAGIEKTGRILDLNGFAWQNKTYQNVVLQVKSEGSLVIQDSVGTGKIARKDSNGAALDVDGKLTITGTVTIDAPIDIAIAGTVDLRSATNCEGWVVDNATFDLSTLEGYTLMLYADEWLPDGYALKIGTKINYELDASDTGTIVAHSTCTENGWGNDEKSHWKKCDCGRTLIYGLHSMKFVDNGDGTHSLICTDCGYPELEDRENLPHTYTYTYDGATHTAACACGATVTEAHTLGYTSAGVGMHDVTCTKNCGYSAAGVPCTNVTYTADANDFRHTVYCNDCRNEYTEDCNAGTCTKCGAYGVIVDNKRLTTANAGDVLGNGTVSYEAAAQTLTLNEANTTYIYSNHKLTVAYSGENTLSQHIGATELVLNADSGAELNAASIGGSNNVDVVINGGAVNLSGADKNPIDAKNLTINNAIVVANNPSYTAPTINLDGKLTLDGNSHLIATRDETGAALVANGLEGDGYHTAVDDTFTWFTGSINNVTIENYYEYVGAEHLGEFVDDKNGTTHTATCACGIPFWENHTYNANNICTVCEFSNIVTVTLDADGVKIVKINGEAKEILHGGTFTAPYGQELKLVFENTFDGTTQTGVCFKSVLRNNKRPPIIGYDSDLYDKATNTLTIPGDKVTGNLEVSALPYVNVKFVLHGAEMTEEGKSQINTEFMGEWDATNTIWQIRAGISTGQVANHFELAGHTFDGMKVDGSDDVVNTLVITGDMTVDILWNCTDTTILTPVEAKDATCKEAGNIAYYICTCGKLYAEDKTTVLTPEQVKTDVDPDNHDFDPDTGTCVCGAVKTYTVTFNPYGDSGAKIVEINGEAKEILHGETFTAPHGQALTVKFENTLSTQETGVYFNGYVFIDQNLIICNYNEATNTLTIPRNKVTGDFVIGADAYVRVQFNLHGGALKDEWKESLEKVFGCTWVADTSTLKAKYGYSTGDFLSEIFQLDGHTFAGAKVNGSDEVVQSLTTTGDATVDILWDCDGSTLTPVPAKDATCIAEGNIAHYICTCGKLYAEESATTVLTPEQVKTDVDPDNHIGMDSTTGKCACDEMLAVAKVEWGGNTTYHETLKDLEAPGCFGTLTLLADCSYDGDAILFKAQENVIDLNGHTLESRSFLMGEHGTLTITGPGTVKGGGITGAEDFEKLIIGANVNLEGTDDYELFFQGGMFDLTQATIPETGWGIYARNTGDDYGKYPTTFGFDNDCDVKLRDGFAAFNTEGNVVAEAAYETIVTIKAHPEHDYVDGVCGCGATCDHDDIDDNGKCEECELQHVASVTVGSEVTYYKTLYDALDAANEKTATVKLLTDVTYAFSIAFYSPSNVTLDMNRQTLTMEAPLGIAPGASLTITGNGTYNKGGNSNAAFTVNSGGTLTIVNGIFKAIPNGGRLFDSSGTLNIQGGTFIADADYNSKPIVLKDSSVVTVTGAPVFKGPADHTDMGGTTFYGTEFSMNGAASLDLSGVTRSMDGWRVKNNDTTNGVTVGQNLILPASGYALKVGENFVTTLADGETGTIVAHTHDYTTAKFDNTYHWDECACGAKQNTAKHTLVTAPNAGEETHSTACACGYQVGGAEAHAFGTDNKCTACKAQAVAMVEAGGTATCYTALETALGAAQGGSKVTLLASVELTNQLSIPSYVTFDGGEFTLSGEKLINSGTITGGTFTATVINFNGDITGGTFDTISYAVGAVSGQISFKTLEINSYSPEIDLSQAVDIVGARIGIITNDLPVSELKLPAGCALEVDGKIVSTLLSAKTGTIVAHEHGYTYTDQGDGTHSGACPCGAITAAEPHAFAQNDAGEWMCVCGVKAVASITSGSTVTEYANFANAVAAWTDGTTLTLLADVTYDNSIAFYGGSYTFVGGNYTLDLGDDAISIYCGTLNNGALTIESGTIKTTEVGPLHVHHKASAKINSDNTKLIGSRYQIAVDGSNSLTITGNGCDGWWIFAGPLNGDVPITIPEGFHLEDEDGNQLVEDKDGNQIAVNDTLPRGKTTVIKADHNHNWSYTADDTADTITATCSADGCRTSEVVVALPDLEFTYDRGNKQTVTPVYSVAGSGLEAEVTYTGDQRNVTREGFTATMKLGEVEVSKTYFITPFSIGRATIGPIPDQTYTGEAIEPTVSPYMHDWILQADEFTVDYENNVNVGEATVTATGKGNYTGEKKAVFNITPASIADATIPAIADQPYTGAAIEPAVTVTMGNKTLEEGTDYDVTYSNNVNVGEATVTFTGKGNYTGEKTTTFKITPADAVVSVNTYLDDEAESDFIYGQTITVKGQVAVAPTTLSLRAKPTPNQVALYCNDVQISEPVTIGENGAYTLTYDTKDKAITPDSGIKLVVKYVGDSTTNMASAAGEVSITLAAKPLSVTDVTAAGRVYDGTTDVAITEVTLAGVIEGDAVSVDVDGLKGTISSADAGEYTSITLPEELPLSGDHAGFYTVEGAMVNANVTISPKAITNPNIELSPDTFAYDGTAKEPAVTVKDVDTVIAESEYTVTYKNNTEVGDATVTIVDAEGGNYTVSGSATFKITKGNSDLTAATYLNDVATTDFIYGQTITVKGQATLQQTFALRQVALNEAALFCGDVQLGEPVTVGADGTYTLTYDTTGKDLSIGDNTLTVVYGGGDNLNGREAEVQIYLGKADPVYTVPTGLTATYGDLLASVELPDGWSWKLEASEIGLKTVGDAGERTHKATYTPPVDTEYYNTAEAGVTITVMPITITGVTGPGNKELDVYCPTVEDVIAKLPKTLTGTDAEGNTYDVPVEWSCDNFNAAPKAENTFTWTALDTNENLSVPEGFSGTINVKNGSAQAVTITAENKEIAYDGNPFDVSTLFTIDENAGAATYIIVSNGTDTGAGTLEGSVLTITKAGTITIQVNTAANTVEGMPYAPGEATAVLTVSKGTLTVTAPTGLTASYGDTLASVTLPTDENGTWAWKDTSTETKVGDAGKRTHKAIFTPTNTDLWEAVEVDVTITVTKAAIILDGVVKSYLVTAEGETETTEFTYGQTITVKAAPVMPAVLSTRSLTPPTPNQMALFIGSTQISAPADADETGTYTLTYNTTEKVLPVGTSDLLVKYVGTENHNPGMITLPVVINPAELTVKSVTAQSRPYQQGNLFVAVTGVELDGKKVDTDDVSVDLTGLQASVASENAGVYGEVVLAEKINLKGAHAGYYTAKGGVTIKLAEETPVEITRAEPQPEGTPDFGDVTPGTELKDVPTGPIEDLFKPIEGTVTWDDPDAPVEPGEEYGWTFTPEDTNYAPVTGESVIIPVAPPQPPVQPDPVDLPRIIWPTQEQFVTLNEGDTVTLPVTAINADRYQWYVNRGDGQGYTPISGADAASLTITVTEWENGNVYLCRVSNEHGSVNSPVFRLEVLPAVDVPPTGDAAPIQLWTALLLLSAAGLLLVRKNRFNLG